MKLAAILVEDLYQELELWYPYYRLIEEGIKVDIVGPAAEKTYQSKLGYPAKTTKAADAIDSNNYTAVIIPGGYAPDRMRLHKPMVNFVKSAYENDKIVAAICHAGWMLCSADILQGKKATCYHAIKDDLKHAGADYVDQSVVVDGNIITSRTPDDLPDFCKAILNALKDNKD